MDSEFQLPDFSSSHIFTPPDLPNMQIYPRKVSIVEDEKSFNQLIILGNGFDLACGLKSTYRDFFDYILYKKEAENNYWYFVFQSLNSRNRLNNNWTDIERQILVELKNIEFLYKKGIFKKGELNVRSKASDFVNSLSESPEDYSLRVTALAAASAIQQHYFEIPSKKELQTHLIKKILLLEEHFCNYLNEQIEIEQSHIDDYFINNEDKGQNNYFIKSLIIEYFILTSKIPSIPLEKIISILEKIKENDSFDSFFNQIQGINQLFLDDEDDEIEIIKNNILSFNYTESFKDLNIRNIHGALSEGNIIFGIDYDRLKVNFEQPPIEFSKSYRILENGRSTSMNISSDINIIKFYGHGLGEADYSYFQAIFDSVDLYHSNTKIVFYWSDYQGVEKQAIRVEQVKNVTKLIEEYGTTFTNKDHGRNLLTKLQLENRLQIEEIPIEELLQYVN
ncbi:bacteriophage abortive infection AbiH family protein [Lactococcus lactis]|uniref:bacteriophage abortive infection AbiH family protein n=1 Tax=Lactococcus lactis TaxID=1358 RepID=UPI00223AA745|nr:bacteriophage abortive infection AbiH family protein [Lactococcus lactis]MCT1173548.1 hypothetical protein [Lactococcus lactis]